MSTREQVRHVHISDLKKGGIPVVAKKHLQMLMGFMEMDFPGGTIYRALKLQVLFSVDFKYQI